MADVLFLAGASGAIGRRLVPLLVADGWRVVGTTRSPEKLREIAALGAEPVVLEIFDADAVRAALHAARPRVVMHQLTNLPDGLDPALMADAVPANARIREVGTRNLVAAAVSAGARRLVAQSVAFAYAPGPRPYRETDPLNVAAEGPSGITARGVASLETQVMAAPLEGVVLRYGALHGPGTGFKGPQRTGSLHVDAAADVARIAASRGPPGIYNVADDDGIVSVDKAAAELGWRPVGRADTRGRTAH